MLGERLTRQSKAFLIFLTQQGISEDSPGELAIASGTGLPFTMAVVN